MIQIRQRLLKVIYIKENYQEGNLRLQGFLFIQGLPYCDVEGSLELRLCLHDDFNNNAPRMVKNVQ